MTGVKQSQLLVLRLSLEFDNKTYGKVEGVQLGKTLQFISSFEFRLPSPRDRVEGMVGGEVKEVYSLDPFSIPSPKRSLHTYSGPLCLVPFQKLAVVSGSWWLKGILGFCFDPDLRLELEDLTQSKKILNFLKC